jgi:16S rRNA processing protein RimM
LIKSKFVHVGTFGAAIGLKGEIKLILLTSTIDVFKALGEYYNFDKSIKWSFESIVMRKEKCVALPSNCKNRNEAEELKNQKIFSFRENFPSTDPNEYYVSDLIGCEIFNKNGNFLGNVISVDNFGAGDLLEIIYKDNKIYIPLNDDNVLSVDLEKKIIFVNPIKGIVDND